MQDAHARGKYVKEGKEEMPELHTKRIYAFLPPNKLTVHKTSHEKVVLRYFS